MAATVNIVRTSVQNRSRSGKTLPVPDAEYIDQQYFSDVSTSQQTTNAAAGSGQYWIIQAIGGAIWVAAGANPTAAAETGWHVPSGDRLALAAQDGEKLAVIDA